MKRILLILIFVYANIICTYAQFPEGFDKAGTRFRNVTSDITYVLLDTSGLQQNTTIHKVTLVRSLITRPKPTSLTINVYNVLFDQKNLAVFSVMPSLLSISPVWKKIDIDTIKNRLLQIEQLNDVMKSSFTNYFKQKNNRLERCKYWNYVVIIKKTDGYYCNVTDCITEFFSIANTNDKTQPAGFIIDTTAKTLSIAEYEADYRRRDGGYSSNYKGSENDSFNNDVKDGPRLNLSYIINDNGKKAYKFWLLDQWIIHGPNYRRGSDRFTFKPGIGIIGASYDFYIYDIMNYWYHDPKPPGKIIKGSKLDKSTYYLTHYFFEYNPEYNLGFLEYLTEDVIKYVTIEKL